jgi:hypothetical protein
VSGTSKAPAVHSQTAATSSDTVTVGCKLPHGFILQLHEFQEYQEPVMGGGTRPVKRAVPVGQKVFINGTAHPQNAAPRCLIVDGFAITPNIPAALWDKWSQDHADADVLDPDRPLLKAFRRRTDTEAWARESAGARTGQERLDPDALPDIGAPHKIQSNNKKEAA